MISFLVTYYNQEKYVYDSLNSIYNAELSGKYEVLVGDDGSSDGTVKEIEKWRDKFGDKLRVFVGDRGDGVEDTVVRASNLRKFLLGQSRGEYFCVLDGDDYYCNQEFIQGAIKVLDKEEDISVVMFNYAMVYLNRTEIHKLDIEEGRIDNITYIRNFYSPAGACIMRKPENSFLEKLEFSLYYDDNDIVIYQLNFGNIWYVNQTIYMYRQHNDSIWHSITRAQQGVLNLLGACNEVILLPTYSEEIYYRYRRDILYAYFRRNRLAKSIGEKFYSKCLNFCVRKNLFLGSFLLSYANNVSHNCEDEEKVDSIIATIKRDDYITYDEVKRNVEGEMQ